MKYIKTFIYITLIMLIIAAMALSCAPKPAEEQPVKIGALWPYTGYNAVLLPGIEGATKLKLDEVGWEVAGRKIELITEDHATDPVVAVDKAKKLVEHDAVDVVLAPVHSGCSFSVADYLTDSGTPYMHLMHNSIDIVRLGGGNVFMAWGTLLGLGYPLGLYAYDEMGFKTATVAYDDFIAGEEFAGGVIQGFEERGGTIVQKQAIAPGTMDFSAYLVGMKEADVCVFWFTPESSLRFVTQYHEYGLKMPLLLPCNAVLFPEMLAQLGDISLGIVGSNLYTPLIETDMNKRYVASFVERYGFMPPTEGTSSYVGLSIYLEAVKATGGDTSFDAIIEALHKIKVETPVGAFSYNPEGLGIGDLYIQEVIKMGDGYAWKPIYKYEQILLDVPK